MVHSDKEIQKVISVCNKFARDLYLDEKSFNNDLRHYYDQIKWYGKK